MVGTIDLRYTTTNAGGQRFQIFQISGNINRNINFTNVCHMGCKFCNFAKRMNDKNAEWLGLEEIVFRAQEAWDRGATEVCIQGGLHPKMFGDSFHIGIGEQRARGFATVGTGKAFRAFKLGIVQFLHGIVEILGRTLF